MNFKPAYNPFTMELTIAPQSYQPDGHALIRAVHSAAAVLARTVVQEEEIPQVAGTVVYLNPTRPGVRAINFTSAVELPDNASPAQATAMMQSIDNHFTSQNAVCQMLYPRKATLIGVMEDAAQTAGYQAIRRRVFLLSRYRRPDAINENVQIVPARAIYPQLDGFYQNMARVEHHADAQLASHFAHTMIDFLDEPRLEMLIARIDGNNMAAAGVLSLGQIGVLIPAWSDPQSRGRGIAKTLMTHVLDFCARALFTQVIIDRSEHCTAIPFYQSLGFSPVAEFSKYRRQSS